MLGDFIQAVLGIGLALLLAYLGVTKQLAIWLAKKPAAERLFDKAQAAIKNGLKKE